MTGQMPLWPEFFPKNQEREPAESQRDLSLAPLLPGRKFSAGGRRGETLTLVPCGPAAWHGPHSHPSVFSGEPRGHRTQQMGGGHCVCHVTPLNPTLTSDKAALAPSHFVCMLEPVTYTPPVFRGHTPTCFPCCCESNSSSFLVQQPPCHFPPPFCGQWVVATVAMVTASE